MIVIPVLGCAGCGSTSAGSAQPEPAAQAARAAPTTPVEVTLAAERVGGSVRIDVTGLGRRLPESHPMERLENWTITAMAGEQELRRMVNGSVRVSRHPVGPASAGAWDIMVTFAVAFAVPAEVEELTLRILPPGAAPVEMTLRLDP